MLAVVGTVVALIPLQLLRGPCLSPRLPLPHFQDSQEADLNPPTLVGCGIAAKWAMCTPGVLLLYPRINEASFACDESVGECNEMETDSWLPVISISMAQAAHVRPGRLRN